MQRPGCSKNRKGDCLTRTDCDWIVGKGCRSHINTINSNTIKNVKGLTKKELYNKAKELGIKGRSTLSKEGLEVAIEYAQKKKKDDSIVKTDKYPVITQPHIYEYIQNNIEGENVKDYLPIVDRFTLYSMNKMKQHKDLKIVRLIHKLSDIPPAYIHIIKSHLWEIHESKFTAFAGVLSNRYKFFFVCKQAEATQNDYSDYYEDVPYDYIDTLLLIEIEPDVIITYRERNGKPKTHEKILESANVFELNTTLHIRGNATFSDSEIKKDPLAFCKLFEKEVHKHIGKMSIWNYNKKHTFKIRKISAFKTMKPGQFKEAHEVYKKVKNKAESYDITTFKYPWKLTTKSGIEIDIRLNFVEVNNISLEVTVSLEGEKTLYCFSKHCELYIDMSEDELTNVWKIVYRILTDFFSNEKNRDEILKFHATSLRKLNVKQPSIIENIIPKLAKYPIFNVTIDSP